MRRSRVVKNYSTNFKETMLQKVFADKTNSVKAIAKQQGMPYETLSTWVRKAKESSMTDTPSKFSSRLSLEQKFQLILEAQSLRGEEFGKFLREKGLFSHQLEQWKKDLIQSFAQLSPPRKKENDPNTLKIAQLEKEIALKDKTLAEASILLLLKKKHENLWLKEENETKLL